MSIEFYCEECYQKVTTPNETAGKKGRCPHCQQVINIPLHTQSAVTRQRPGPTGAGSSSRPPAPIAPPLGMPPGLSPSQVPGAAYDQGRDEGWRETDKMARWGDFTKEESQLRRQEMRREEARKVLSAPAVGMIICSVIGMLSTAGYVVALALAITAVFEVAAEQLNPGMLVLHSVLIVANIAVHSLVIIGANHMRLTRSYTMAIAGAVMCMLPFPLNLTCLFSAAFGIWALILLAKKDIRDAFKRL